MRALPQVHARGWHEKAENIAILNSESKLLCFKIILHFFLRRFFFEHKRLLIFCSIQHNKYMSWDNASAVYPLPTRFATPPIRSIWMDSFPVSPFLINRHSSRRSRCRHRHGVASPLGLSGLISSTMYYRWSCHWSSGSSWRYFMTS